MTEFEFDPMDMYETWKKNPWCGLVRHYETDEVGNLLVEHTHYMDGTYDRYDRRE